MWNYYKRYAGIQVFLLLLMLTPWAAHAGAAGQQKTADGLSVYVGVLPAEMLLGHPKEHHEREMHGGIPAGANRFHVVVAIFDAATGKRITDAQVKIGGASIGMAPSRKKAEPMLINKTISYGHYVTMPGGGPYKIQVEILRPGSTKPITMEFDYPFARA